MHYKIFNVNDEEQIKSVDSLSRSIAETVTGSFNDQVTILITGNRGSGKSYLGLELGVKISQEIAKVKGGNPDKYFSLDNVAIIKLDRVLEVLERLQQYGVYFLDDIGVGYSSREWRSDKNIRMNKIIQTFRTDNVVTILSVPEKGLLDKVPRDLIDKYIETSKDNNLYTHGLNLIKVFNIERLLREGKQLEILPIIEHKNEISQYAKYLTRKPPASITEPYEAMRKKIAQDLRKEEAQAMRTGEIEPKPKKATKHDQIIEHRRKWESDKKGKTWIDYISGKGFDPDYASHVVTKDKRNNIMTD